jgi:YcxB-like protein
MTTDSKPAVRGNLAPCVGLASRSMPVNQVSVSFTPRVLDLLRGTLVIRFLRPGVLIVFVGLPILVGITSAILSNAGLTGTIVLVAVELVAFWLIFPLLLTLRHSESRQWRSLTFSEGGVLVKKSESESSYDWRTFDLMRSGRRGYLLSSMEHHRFIWIPSGAFASPADQAAFRQIVASHIG